MKPVHLSPTEIASALDRLSGWSIEDGALERSLRFPDFAAAFAFMTAVAAKAEEMNHHPEWSNSHALVEIRLRSHDAGGLTALDFELAQFIDALPGLPMV